MNRVILVICMLILVGCSLKKEEFRYLPLQQCRKAAWKDVGVVDVELPDYFIDDQFPYKEHGDLGYLKDRIARDPVEFLTSCAARMLGGCTYPWECSQKPKKIYRIKIEEFYYDRSRDVVILIASEHHKEFRIKKRVNGDPLKSAFDAYKELIAQIGK